MYLDKINENEDKVLSEIEYQRLEEMLDILFEKNIDILMEFIDDDFDDDEDDIDEDDIDTIESVNETRFKQVKRAVVTRKDKVAKLSKASALIIAKQENDPLYNKMIRKKKEYLELREKIRIRNKSKAKKKAVEFVANRNVNGGLNK